MESGRIKEEIEMKVTGITRKIDSLGRVVIPKSIRNAQGLDEDATIEFLLNGDIICIKKYEQTCLVCGKANNIEVSGRNICPDCQREVLKWNNVSIAEDME